jgi:RNA polymerase sigma factor (TIGR02999 family)
VAAKGKITTLLEKARRGDTQADREAWAHAYDDLRVRAGRVLRRYDQPTLQRTELVNETYQQIADDRARGKWLAPVDSHHLFAFITQRMKWVLRDRRRASRAAKRGGDVPHVPITTGVEIADVPRGRAGELESVLAWLKEQGREDLAGLVVCRAQEGLTIEETATRLGWSTAKVKRQWKFLKGMLAFRERE